ncbi:MAG: hypothetical protein LBO78_02025 [Rickettsiales bacterium]|nr:hypothetical protein [Rickettsiales bacterium]
MSFPLLIKLDITENELWQLMLAHGVSIDSCNRMRRQGIIFQKHVVHLFNVAMKRNLNLSYPDDFQDMSKFK